MKRTNVRKV